MRDSAATERDFVPLVEEPAFCASPRWSPDGTRLYFLSTRDGFGCLWMQRVDAVTGRPVGGPVAIVHNHRADRSLFGPRNAWSIAVTRDRVFFNAAEMRGNFWRAKLDPR